MTPARADATDEVRRLQGCLNDLISVMALPALWSGRGSSEIVGALLGGVARMLRLEFAYARLTHPFEHAPADWIRPALGADSAISLAVVGDGLLRRLKTDSPGARQRITNPIGEDKVSIAYFPLGLHEGIGVMVVASRREDFPTQIEELLLQVAANQAAIGLQEARRLEEQRRAARTLEQRVQARTAELSALNEVLRGEMAERERAQAEALELKDELAAELLEMTRLHELSTHLHAASDLQAVLEDVLDAVISQQSADFGNVQLYNAETKALEIVAQRGLKSDFLTHIARPLTSRSGENLGLISTYFRETRRFQDDELRFTDLYARQAAEMIDRNRSERALERSEAYLAEGQRISHTGSWTWRPNSELFWSDEHYRILGFDPGVVKPSHEVFLARVHPDDVAMVKDRFADAVRERADYECEYRIVRPDGTARHVHALGRPVLDRSGRLAEFVGTVIDTTERRRAEDALRGARDELAHMARVTTMGELTASIAHEVNQPLAAVVTNANACVHWLAAKPANVAEAQAAAQRIIRDANRASQVITHIRAFLTRGKPRKVALAIEEVVSEVLSLVEREASAKGIALEAPPSGNLPRVMGDRIQLQQVLLNLVVNAIEALGPQGDRARAIEIGAQRHDRNEVRVSVRDSGPGIDPKELESVFEMFYTTKPGGMGMGLAISRSIIENHGGKLWATRNEGVGETFHFTLPAAKGDSP